MPRKFGQPRLNQQNTQRRTLAAERVTYLKTAAGDGRSAQFLRTQWDHAPVTPSWGTYQGLADEIGGWGLSVDESGQEKVQFALARHRFAGKMSKIEAAAYANGYKDNPNSKISKTFMPLIEGTVKKLVTASTVHYDAGHELGWTGYTDENRERMLQLLPGSNKDENWNAFYYASTREQAEGYGDNVARVVVADATDAQVLRINDLFFAANLPGDYKADKLKSELSLPSSQTLMPGLGKLGSLHIVIGLEGLDSAAELENIVPWAHAQAFLALDEVED